MVRIAKILTVVQNNVIHVAVWFVRNAILGIMDLPVRQTVQRTVSIILVIKIMAFAPKVAYPELMDSSANSAARRIA